MTKTERNTLIDLVAEQINKWVSYEKMVFEDPEFTEYQKWAREALAEVSVMCKMAEAVGIESIECHRRAVEINSETQEVA